MPQQGIAQRLSEPDNMWIPIFVSLGMVTFLLGADALIERRPFAPRIFWALFDVLIHGVLALLIVFPIFGTPGLTGKTIALFCVVFFAATLLDLDHFIAAGSLDLDDSLSLTMRPVTHSLTFAAAIGLIFVVVTRNPLAGWVIFAALASHVLRDAAGGLTPIIWPLSMSSIPQWLYYLGEIALFCGSFFLMQKARP